MKRLTDVVMSSLLLVLLGPLILLVAVMVRRRLGQPVFYRQLRPGKDSVLFELIKFRTMTDDHDDAGALLSDAERVTGFGQWLRRYSLDELPELINVLRGDMSLVGPRPLLVTYLPLYSELHARRHEVRPGITGWAQVNGRNAISWEQKFELDVWYVDHRGAWLDFRILCMTFIKVVRADGISQPGHISADEFRGYTR